MKKQSQINEKPWFLDWDWKIPSGFNKDWKFNPTAYDPQAPYKVKWKTFRLKSNPDVELEDPFDLNNLRFINPDKVKHTLEEIEKLVPTGKELVCMIGTWWTISMTLQNGKLRPGLNPDNLLAFAGWWLAERFGIVSFELETQIDSSQMEIDYIWDLVIAMSWFYENMSNKAKAKFSWFFITHGTDTLTTSSTYANIMLGANYPFSAWFVAAQKTVADRFSDVGINFTFGINMLSELRRSRMNIIFATAWWTSWWAYIPSTSIKVSDTDVVAFATPGRHKLIDVSNFLSAGIDTYFIKLNESQKTVDDIFQPIILRWHVPISTIVAKVWVNPNWLYEHVKAIHDLAIMLVTYGWFTFSPKQVDAIVRAARENKSALFAANPFPTGSTKHLYAEALYLKEQGITSIHCLEHAAYAKVKWAQAVWWNDIHKIKMFLMGNNFMGEQPYDWQPPLEVIEELSRPNGFKIRQIWQPVESLIKL